MPTRRALLADLTAAPLIAGMSGLASADDKIGVTASISILGDLVRQVGGDRVDVTVLVGPNGDAHVFQPSPADARALSASRVLVLNGLGLEGWMERLEQAAGFKGLLVTATAGVKPQEMEEDGGAGRPKKVLDPHAWQSLANGRLYVANIRDGLSKADPDGRAAYEANAGRLLAAIDALEPDVQAMLARIPAGRRKIITTHDAFGYFGTAYGIRFISPEGVSTESEPSAADVARIIRQIRAEKIPAVFLENVSDRRLLDRISRETGARIGGTLFSDALSPPDGPAPTYLDMFRHNVRTLAAALTPSG